jgi:hypothetical protein
MIGNLTIAQSFVMALGSGREAASIGTGGVGYPGTASIKRLTIDGGSVTTGGFRGTIGAGYQGSVSLLQFSGHAIVNANTLSAASIVMSNGSLVFLTNETRLLHGPLATFGRVDLSILYSRPTHELSEVVSALKCPFVHIGNLNIPDGSGWRFCVSWLGFEKCFFDEFCDIRSFLISVPTTGHYSISAERGDLFGFLSQPGGLPSFQVNSSRLFVATSTFVRAEKPGATETQSHHDEV